MSSCDLHFKVLIEKLSIADKDNFYAYTPILIKNNQEISCG